MAGSVVWSGAGFGYACGCILAFAFVTAAVTKVLRRAETAAGFTALGIPGASVVARVVPVAELAVALALLLAPRIGGVVALALLGAFTVFLAHAIGTGVRAPCNCFGPSAGQPISSVDLVRNAILAGLAIGALFADKPVALSLTALSTLTALFGVVPAGAMLRWLRIRQARRPRVEPTS